MCICICIYVYMCMYAWMYVCLCIITSPPKWLGRQGIPLYLVFCVVLVLLGLSTHIMHILTVYAHQTTHIKPQKNTCWPPNPASPCSLATDNIYFICHCHSLILSFTIFYYIPRKSPNITKPFPSHHHIFVLQTIPKWREGLSQMTLQ